MKKMKKASALVLTGVLALSLTAPICTTTAQAAKIKLNKTTVYLLKGKSFKLKITGTKKKVTWKSSKKKVATVSKKGKVKAKNAGKATITAKVGKKKYKCKVIVETKKQQKARLKKEAAKKAAAEKAKKEAAEKAKRNAAAAKMRKQAIALRNYVMKKGTPIYEGSSGYADEYEIEENIDIDDTVPVKVSVKAFHSTDMLRFFWSKSFDNSGDIFQMEFTIDLTRGTIKKGTFKYEWQSEYDNMNYKEGRGTLTTLYNSKKRTGLTLKQYTISELTSGDSFTDENVTTTYTAAADLKAYQAEIYDYAEEAFTELDELLLNERGYSMAEIGFANWNK